MKKKSLRAILAVVFASLLSVAMIACEEEGDLGDDLEDAGEEIKEGGEDAFD